MATITSITPLLSWFLREQPISSKFNSELRNKVNTLITNHVVINNGLEGLLQGASGGDQQAKISFGLAAAPTGWTRDTSFSNDQALRVTDGVGGGEAGNWVVSGFSTNIVGDHSHTLAAHTHGLGNHTHSITNHTHGSGLHIHDTGSHIGHVAPSVQTVIQGVSGANIKPLNQVLFRAFDGHFHTSSFHSHTATNMISDSPTGQGSGTGNPTGFPSSGTPSTSTTDGPSTDTSGVTGSHSHSIANDATWRPQYVNVLLCKKD